MHAPPPRCSACSASRLAPCAPCGPPVPVIVLSLRYIRHAHMRPDTILPGLGLPVPAAACPRVRSRPCLCRPLYCCCLQYKGHVFNAVDTPGHADFGGEVER